MDPAGQGSGMTYAAEHDPRGVGPDPSDPWGAPPSTTSQTFVKLEALGLPGESSEPVHIPRDGGRRSPREHFGVPPHPGGVS